MRAFLFLFLRVIPLKMCSLPLTIGFHMPFNFHSRLLSLFTHWSILHAFVNESVHSENHQKGSIRTNFIKENVQKTQTLNSFDFVFPTIYIFTSPSSSLLQWCIFSFALKILSSMWIDDVSMQTKRKKNYIPKAATVFFSTSKNVLNSQSHKYTYKFRFWHNRFAVKCKQNVFGYRFHDTSKRNWNSLQHTHRKWKKIDYLICRKTSKKKKHEQTIVSLKSYPHRTPDVEEKKKNNIAIVECLVTGRVLSIFYKCNQNETELTESQYKYLFLFSWEKKKTESLLNFRYTFSSYSFFFFVWSREHFFFSIIHEWNFRRNSFGRQSYIEVRIKIWECRMSQYKAFESNHFKWFGEKSNRMPEIKSNKSYTFFFFLSMFCSAIGPKKN